MQIQTSPAIQNYRDYRDYLNDWFKARKAGNAKMSFRFMARQLGLKSPNHFQLVITKQRHFSETTLQRMQKILKLRPKEKTYLENLFLIATESSETRRRELADKIDRLNHELMTAGTSHENYSLLANSLAWFLKMGALRFHGKSAAEIEALVREGCPFKIGEHDVASALATLQKMQAVSVVNGVYEFEFDHLKTDWDFDDQKIKQFHYNNLMYAMQSIPWPIQDRFFSNVTIPANADVLDTAKKEIRDLCLKLLEISNARVTTEGECEQVVSLQFAMFPFFKWS